MRRINIKPVTVIGHCRANLSVQDEIQIEGSNLRNPEQSSVCVFALGKLPPAISVLQRGGNRFFAHARCQNCTGLGQENRVVFLLGHADKWELCQALSEYRLLCGECEAPAAARELKARALEYQDKGEYARAVQTMGAAVEELKSVVALRGPFGYYNRTQSEL